MKDPDAKFGSRLIINLHWNTTTGGKKKVEVWAYSQNARLGLSVKGWRLEASKTLTEWMKSIRRKFEEMGERINEPKRHTWRYF